MTTTRIRAGAEAVMAILPHRAPLLLVDRIESFEDGERPTLRAARAISVHEPVFAGHFPDLLLWPGIYTIEGMGQSCQILLTWLMVVEGFAREGLTPDDAAAALRGLDARAQMRAGASPPAAAALRAALDAPHAHVGVSAAVDVRFFDPVFAGDLIEYEVRLTHARDAVRRFEVQATVDRKPVARGTMTGALVRRGHAGT